MNALASYSGKNLIIHVKARLPIRVSYGLEQHNGIGLNVSPVQKDLPQVLSLTNAVESQSHQPCTHSVWASTHRLWGGGRQGVS